MGSKFNDDNNENFIDKNEKENEIIKNELIIVYTDGACSNNGKKDAKAGIGVFFGDNDPRNYSGPLEGKGQTNNRAEIMASIVALKRSNIKSDIKIVTDSSYLKNSITQWMYKWKENNWKTSNKKDVKNKDLFTILDQIIEKKKKNGSNVLWEWVKGHDICVGNNKADKLACLGINKC